jgi:phosphatidylglycerophosphate synthase
MTIFLTKSEKETLSGCEYHVEDNSTMTRVLDPLFNFLVSLVPKNVAPNAITLMGFTCTLFSFYLTYNFFAIWPKLIAFCFALFTFAYMCLDGIDGKQARRIHNSTSFGELLDHSCDSVGIVFMMLNLCYIVGIDNPLAQWYVVQIAQFVFLNSHIEAFRDKVLRFGTFTGPGEPLCVFIGVALIRSIVEFQIDNLINCVNVSMCIYYIMLLYVIYETLTLYNYGTKLCLILTLAISYIQTFLINNGMIDINIMTIIGNGMILSVVTSDMIIAKMASRELHPMVPVFVMLSQINNYLSIGLVCLYYIIVFGEIATHMNIEIFNVFNKCEKKVD